MDGFGETHTSTPNTTDRVREVSRVLDLPSLQMMRHTEMTSVHKRNNMRTFEITTNNKNDKNLVSCLTRSCNLVTLLDLVI